MKKILLVSFIALISFSACKKEKKQAKPIDEAIISTTWITTVDKREYLNEAGSKLDEVSHEIGWRYKFNGEAKTVNVTDPKREKTVKKSYSLEQANGKHYVVISDAKSSERFEITAYTDKTMSWRQEKPNQTYSDGKVAAKEMVIIDFHCPCRD
jgi:hypothetical protein